MADSVSYQRIVLYMEHPWQYAGESVHRWSVKFSLSGGTDLLASEMEATALALWQPISYISRPSGHLVGWRYYPIQGHTATGIKDYLAGEHPCTRLAYVPPAGQEQQLEVCALAEAPCGKSSTGKPVFLRKWIHGVQGDAEGNTFHAPNSTPGATTLDPWNNGAGPRLLRPCDPTGGLIGGPWTFNTHLFTHQLRRGPKRKAKTTTVFFPFPIP